MPLTKSKGNMYPWVTHTHTHLGGKCPHACLYCYVQAIAMRFGQERYKGPLCMIEAELKVPYGKGRTIFVDHCNDLWAEAVPTSWIEAVLAHCSKYPDNEYVFQTKNPGRYRGLLSLMPPKRLLGCTIETSDEAVASGVSKAPSPDKRFLGINDVRIDGERVFITIEPILIGQMHRLAHMCRIIKPEFVNIGADSKGRNLNEPRGARVNELIDLLTGYGVEIRQKSNLERLCSQSETGGTTAGKEQG